MTMLAPAAPSYLDVYLAPILPLLTRSDVTDIFINQPGEVWIERLGGAIERMEAPDLDEPHLWRLAKQIASLSHQGINREHPILSATLPDGARVQIVAPPATRAHMAIAIRRNVSADLSLADYRSGGAFRSTRSTPQPVQADDDHAERLTDYATLLRDAVLARKTILISGGTSSGKTTFLNALMREIPRSERLIFIEDAPELIPQHANLVGLVATRGALGEARLTTDDLLQAALRMRPDRILLGEIRGPEAFTFLKAVNSGHPGSLTTIHANGPERAVEQLALLCLQAGARLRYEDVVRYILSIVDLYVHLHRAEGRREVASICRRQDLRNLADMTQERHENPNKSI